MPWYGTAKDYFLNAGINRDVPDSAPVLKVCGVDSSYTFNANHATLADLGESIVLEPKEIPNVAWALGLIDGDEVLYERPDSVGLTENAAVLLLEWDDGSQLLAYTQASESGTLPFTFVEANVIIRWPNGGIIQL